jgi:hypothetical protein
LQCRAAGEVNELIVDLYIRELEAVEVVRDESEAFKLNAGAIAQDVEGKYPSSAQEDIADPEVEAPDLVIVEVSQSEDACIEGGASAEEQHMVQELADGVDRLRAVQVAAHDVKGRGGFPEMAPAAGEHARLHGAVRGEEGQHVAEDVVWEGAQEIAAGQPRRRAPALPSAPFHRTGGAERPELFPIISLGFSHIALK